MNTTIIKTHNEVLTDYPLVLGSYIVKCKSDSLINDFVVMPNTLILVLSGDAYIIKPSGDLVKEVVNNSSLRIRTNVQLKKDSIIRVIDNYKNERPLIFRDDILAAGTYDVLPFLRGMDYIEDTSLSFLKGKIFREIWLDTYPYPVNIENLIMTNLGRFNANVFGNLDNYLDKVAEIKKSGVLTITFLKNTLIYNNTLLVLNGKKKFLFTEEGWTETTI